MTRRLSSVLLAAGMVASLLLALPASAAPPTLSENPHIVDPKGDANTTTGDQVTPAGSVSNVGDLLAVWFTDAGSKFAVHFQTGAPPPASHYGMGFRVDASPNESGTKCFIARAVIPGSSPGGGAYQGVPRARVFDACGVGTNWFSHGFEGEVEYGAVGDGTGYVTMTFEKSLAATTANGFKIAAPTARTDFLAGDGETAKAFQAVRADDTKAGTDYTIGSGGGGKPDPGPGTPPGDPGTDPGKGDGEPKKDCSKKKGKAKKKCKKGQGPKEAPKGCAAFVPGDLGKDAETLIVTDKHTAEAPLEFKMSHGQAVYPASASDLYSNVQVDSKAKEAGLYISYEFPDYEDHDLYVHYADGTDAATVGGFNPAPVVPQLPVINYGTDGKGSGGHSEMGAEVLDGLRTADCQGWTVNWHNFLGQGGEYTAKLWLGEIQNDPAPPA